MPSGLCLAVAFEYDRGCQRLGFDHGGDVDPHRRHRLRYRVNSIPTFRSTQVLAGWSLPEPVPPIPPTRIGPRYGSFRNGRRLYHGQPALALPVLLGAIQSCRW